MIDEKQVKKALLEEQKNEITGHLIYKKLSVKIKDKSNAKILKRISDDELKHYEQLKSLTQTDVSPKFFKVHLYTFISLVFGLTFGIKLLEKGEDQAQYQYAQMLDNGDVIQGILSDEEVHEQELIAMIDEERLNYIGSVVLGLNDALVELTGALAGYTFAFQNTKIIALTGLITGISASFSMAASEYLSSRQEEDELAQKTAAKSALYTGIAYVITVALLIMPFLLIQNPFVSLILTLFTAVVIIFGFNYYISVAKDVPFKKRFIEMALISLGVSGISFLVGVAVKVIFGIEI
ncbi:VIT1/CCC1 transporter family protein [Fusibacter ferrireducens]|uniref:VIT1/CCC1 transporter family protein n=1 Tax=Fusibacter ferrireducens TaxID=2785058 RepID=A0ABR9ZR26_9FIRM|nr:VIT1/CCC1 transporter family protein [Fusibacter ferrireducens]MBF4692893.1 VIT1/CCC1 transporter family protein [Fusibacter ferrireducens]